MRDYVELLKRYMLIFDETFPTEMAPADEEEQMDIIENCLSRNEPYNPYEEGKIDQDALY